MHSDKRFGRFVIYIEACYSGSMLEGIPTDINVYGVTAVGTDKPSLGTYCGSEATINGTAMKTCLGDLFTITFMNFIVEKSGSESLQTLFTEVGTKVASWASLHYSHQEIQQYGDVSGIGSLTLSEFFYPDSLSAGLLGSSLADKGVVIDLPTWKDPKIVYSQVRIEQQQVYDIYTEASALPLEEDGEVKWEEMKVATRSMQDKILNQERVQDVYWHLVQLAFSDKSRQERCWRQKRKAHEQQCEVAVHTALRRACGMRDTDMTTSYALQFHQVVVNLCGDPDLSWGQDPHHGEEAAEEACRMVQKKWRSAFDAIEALRSGVLIFP
jgi:hypothetical protein